MRTILCTLCLLCVCLKLMSQQSLQTVNAILNDESYVVLFGDYPTKNTNEQVRLQTHLLYVEALLRSSDVTHLNPTQLQHRALVLNLLHEYTIKGIFPVNTVYSGERRPCFIDDNGNICAVGFLIEQTAGRETAEKINENHQYDYLLDMQEPAIEAWADQYGLTLRECAMIQPSYGPPPQPQQINADIKKGYGISSGIVGGANLALIATSFSPQYRNRKTMSCLGIATGTVQLVMGLTNIQKAKTDYVINGPQITTYYKAQNNLSYGNIAVGTATMVTSAFNLLMHQKNNQSKTTVNIYSYPDNRSLAMGVYFTRKL